MLAILNARAKEVGQVGDIITYLVEGVRCRFFNISMIRSFNGT
jgi:hypothetical protein